MNDQTNVDELAEPVFPKVRDTFYVVVTRKLNGALDVSSEGFEPTELAPAIETAIERVENYGDDWFVIECRAVRKVVDRKPRVLTLRPHR